ncbi:hypothetical protein K8I28_12095 [bacterium]|nr:hypothetical protein [bacterium]
MAMFRLNSIGFCAHYSREGDQAFNVAFRIAKSRNLQLNIFHFMEDPYDPESCPPSNLDERELEKFILERERDLRFYYDSRLEDYVDVGFRLCENNEWTELHRCLVKREFDVLVLCNPHDDATFVGKPLPVFANSFVSPVILVGPKPEEYLLNRQAAMLVDRLGLENMEWRVVDSVLAAV